MPSPGQRLPSTLKKLETHWRLLGDPDAQLEYLKGFERHAGIFSRKASSGVLVPQSEEARTKLLVRIYKLKCRTVPRIADTFLRRKPAKVSEAQAVFKREALNELGAAHLAKRGYLPEAGELLEAAGRHLDAARTYLRASREPQAHTLMVGKARAAFERAGAFREGAEGLLAIGEEDHAKYLYRAGGLLEEGARRFYDRGLYSHAAELFEEAGIWPQAADAAVASNNVAKAVQLAARHAAGTGVPLHVPSGELEYLAVPRHYSELAGIFE